MSPRTLLEDRISFLVVVCSGLAWGIWGMYCSIREHPTASAARTSLNKAPQMALRGGAVTGLRWWRLPPGVGTLFLFFGGLEHPETPSIGRLGLSVAGGIVCTARRGIYTKAADVALTWWVRSRLEFLRTIHATRR